MELHPRNLPLQKFLIPISLWEIYMTLRSEYVINLLTSQTTTYGVSAILQWREIGVTSVAANEKRWLENRRSRRDRMKRHLCATLNGSVYCSSCIRAIIERPRYDTQGILMSPIKRQALGSALKLHHWDQRRQSGLKSGRSWVRV